MPEEEEEEEEEEEGPFPPLPLLFAPLLCTSWAKYLALAFRCLKRNCARRDAGRLTQEAASNCCSCAGVNSGCAALIAGRAWSW